MQINRPDRGPPDEAVQTTKHPTTANETNPGLGFARLYTIYMQRRLKSAIPAKSFSSSLLNAGLTKLLGLFLAAVARLV